MPLHQMPVETYVRRFFRLILIGECPFLSQFAEDIIDSDLGLLPDKMAAGFHHAAACVITLYFQPWVQTHGRVSSTAT